MRNKLTDYDKTFIIGNNDILTVPEMSKQLNLLDGTIYIFLKDQGLKTLTQKRIEERTKSLSPRDKAIIRKHHADMTVSELARAVNNGNYQVMKYLKEQNLTAKKILQLDYKPKQPVQQYNVVTQTFERPPAEYSNKQWNEI